MAPFQKQNKTANLDDKNRQLRSGFNPLQL